MTAIKSTKHNIHIAYITHKPCDGPCGTYREVGYWINNKGFTERERTWTQVPQVFVGVTCHCEVAYEGGISHEEIEEAIENWEEVQITDRDPYTYTEKGKSVMFKEWITFCYKGNMFGYDTVNQTYGYTPAEGVTHEMIMDKVQAYGNRRRWEEAPTNR